MRMEMGDRALLLLTFGLTVLVDLTVAIGVGVTLASLLFMARMSEASGLLSDDESVEDPEQRAALPDGVEVFRLAGPLFFGVASEMLDALTRIGRKPRTIILRLDRVPFIDASGIETLSTFVAQAADSNTAVILTDMPRPVWEALARAHPRFVGAGRTQSLGSALRRVAA
jgi:SulP family sulfate permease